MSSSIIRAGAVIPAQLAFLAIYNPSLGNTDETLHDQIVYYYHHAQPKQSRKTRRPDENRVSEESRDVENEKLRQIGLAQGMVEFAKSFSDGDPVDSIETEKSRIVLHELEAGWWILASIDLTRLTSQVDASAASILKEASASIEYSAREVASATLLVQQLVRAHNIFRLHHASSLADLFVRLTRPNFCSSLERFWEEFAMNWDVLLHGNPAVDCFNGLKLAAGGELGIGVGEEEWGSGEREVLEGFIGRTDGLIDLVVSRFGDVASGDHAMSDTSEVNNVLSSDISHENSWLGAGASPQSSDGVVFSGIGAIGRSSIKDISGWMEWIYKYGEDAYAIRENPSNRRRKRRGLKISKSGQRHPDISLPRHSAKLQNGSSITVKEHTVNSASQSAEHVPGIPRPILPVRQESTNVSTNTQAPKQAESSKRQEREEPGASDSMFSSETMMKYLTLGIYGSSWGIPGKKSSTDINKSADGVHRGSKANTGPSERDTNAKLTITNTKASTDAPKIDHSRGSFLIGLQGDPEGNSDEKQEKQDDDVVTDHDGYGKLSRQDSRVMLRTVHVERIKQSDKAHGEHEQRQFLPDQFDSLRVVVYVHRPFIFTFLFEQHTDSLFMSAFYRSLHHQLSPLQGPLLRSTDPMKVRERLLEAASPKSTSVAANTQPIYDLVYDPANLTVHTSLPNIPEPGTAAAEGLGSIGPPWTRVEALNVHSQVLNTYVTTRKSPSDLEKTCKTNRGWWVVWMRLPAAPANPPTLSLEHREAFLVRKASDYVPPAARKTSGMFSRDISGASGASSWGPANLAEGIGIDARLYIESLLSLNR